MTKVIKVPKESNVSNVSKVCKVPKVSTVWRNNEEKKQAGEELYQALAKLAQPNTWCKLIVSPSQHFETIPGGLLVVGYKMVMKLAQSSKILSWE